MTQIKTNLALLPKNRRVNEESERSTIDERNNDEDDDDDETKLN